MYHYFVSLRACAFAFFVCAFDYRDHLTAVAKGTGSGNKKWDEMLQCLNDYVDEQRRNTPDGKKFVWDGHVPTNFKVRKEDTFLLVFPLCVCTVFAAHPIHVWSVLHFSSFFRFVSLH